METIALPTAQRDTRSSSHPTIRMVGAVIAGLFTWIFIATVLNLALRAWWPHYHEGETAFNFTLGMKVARLVLGAASCVGAGFLATWIGKSRTTAVILGIALLCLFIPEHYIIWHKFPIWYHLTFLVSLLPLVLLGGALKARDLPKGASVGVQA